MFEIFRKYLADKGTFTTHDYELIESVAIEKKLRKRQYLLQEGDVWKHTAFICKGLLRNYFIDNKGEEHIIQFAPENYWAGDWESWTTGLPSKSAIEAIEDSEILMFENKNFNMLLDKLPNFNEFTSKLKDRNILVLRERIYSNITLTAEEKYNHFLSKYPSITNRVPQHMVASYIGISAETLSRIRSNSSKK